MIKKYCVAEHLFSLSMAAEESLWGLLSQYQPFEVESDAEGLFSVTQVVGLERDAEAKLVLQDNVDEPGFPRMDIYRSPEWHYVECLMHSTQELYCRLRISSDNLRCEFELYTDNNMVKINAFNLVVNFAFMFATADLDTLFFHSSAIKTGGKAYLFLGKSGTGKSTHSSMWLKVLGDKAELMNDDHPIVRVSAEGVPIAYGSPWSGKTPCYRNVSAPVGAIVRIKQAPANSIRKFSIVESYGSLMTSCSGISWERQQADGRCATLQKIITSVGCYQVDCLPNTDAAELSISTVKVDL